MKKSLIGNFVGLILLASTCSGSPVVAAGDVVEEQLELTNVAVIKVRSLHPNRVQIKFFSKSFNRTWPGSNSAYGLNDSAFHTFRLNCDRGEKICYGAWVNGNSDQYWGVGNNDEGCDSCCIQCGSEQTYTLNNLN